LRLTNSSCFKEVFDPVVDETDQDERSQGRAQVVGGEVQVVGPAGEGAAGALLTAGEGIMLLVNGEVIEESCRVFPDDKVELYPAEYVEPFQIEVSVTADEMSASARFTPARRISYLLIDQPFAEGLVIKGVRKETDAAGGTIEDLKKALAGAGVCFGLQEPLLPAVLQERLAWRQVAAGEAPVEGRHGYVEPLFAGELKVVRYGLDEERVDFRERFEIEQVEPGDSIAAIHPPVAGKPGHTVTGRRIDPPPVFPASVRCGDGAAMNNEGHVVATRKGVPGFKAGRDYRLRVDNFYIHRGDIDIRSGNANFQGHLEIEGDITEGMKVQAEGDVIVGGTAAGATVLAGGSIIFKQQCIKCQVRAGWKETILLDFYEMVEQLFEALGHALAAADELICVLEQKGRFSERMEAALVRVLLQSKFTEIPELAAELAGKVKEIGPVLPGELLQVINEIVPHFTEYVYSQSLDRPALLKIYDQLQVCLQEKPDDGSGANITAAYVQNSSLACSGDIFITGSGVYNSQFKCGGSVLIKKAFRGGSIEAGGEVQIGEAGSPRLAGDQGLVIVPKESTVSVGRAYDSFRVIFGQWEYRCTETISNVRLRFDQHELAVKLDPWKKA
jgi:hypothetical protein